MNIQNDSALDFSRRDFLRGSSAAALFGMLGGVELKAADAPKGADGKPVNVTKVKLGIIGLGPHGRDLVSTLQLLPAAQIASLCDTYGPMMKRSAGNVPGAKTSADYKSMLQDKDIAAVLIATPTHQHKDIAIAALQAGKHVYCEAPLAHTIDDAKAIARAARAAGAQVFQAGLSLRADPHRRFLLQFIRSGAMGRPLLSRAQWHKKQQWRFASPNAEREKEINWRLDKSVSTGLAGEMGIHQFDMMNWYVKERPVAVTGFGGILQWKDGRDVPDTVQVVFEFPGGSQGFWDGTLGNSFDGEHEMFYGNEAAVMLRGNKAWMFKEVDSPLLGWEIYARKDVFYKETGIALMADATKLAPQGENVEVSQYINTPLYFALENFLSNVNDVISETASFQDTYGDDKPALAKHVASLKQLPTAGWAEGLESAVVAIKANEAINTRQRLEYKKEWFELA